MSDQEEPSTSGQAAEAKAEDAVTHVAKTNRKLSDKKLQKLKDKLERRGVVYFSRLPPHLVRTPTSWQPECPEGGSLHSRL